MNLLKRFALNQAAHLLKDPERLRLLLANSANKAEAHREVGRGFLTQLRALFRLVRAWMTGTYREVPRRSLIAAVAALLYFMNPMDLIPDFILAGGLLDDAAVVGWVLASLRKDLKNFQSWEAIPQ